MRGSERMYVDDYDAGKCQRRSRHQEEKTMSGLDADSRIIIWRHVHSLRMRLDLDGMYYQRSAIVVGGRRATDSKILAGSPSRWYITSNSIQLPSVGTQTMKLGK